MKTIRIRERTGKDGHLSLDLSLGDPDREFDVLIMLRPNQQHESTSDDSWPAGFFERTFGSIDDDTFVRPPQPDLPPTIAIE